MNLSEIRTTVQRDLDWGEAEWTSRDLRPTTEQIARWIAEARRNMVDEATNQSDRGE